VSDVRSSLRLVVSFGRQDSDA